MAGMLTAVVYAGRRNLRNNNTNTNTAGGGGGKFLISSSTRHSFSLDSPNNFEYSSMEKNPLNHANLDEDNNLGGAAREAKQRLDYKFTSSQNRKLEKPKRKCNFGGLWGICPDL
ncbi:hypothetical protein PIB30_023991 [Stylosanthes scabra]|uniref:Uncharacterized protein n=1 Tax=Stylosanthes scabra TaxID=79078 RepID=A0ABU6YA67_9FABA|nr:hypothetical protein [Stylosanthes scabra]